MRILHVITTIRRGGAENHLLDLARMQVARGQDVCVAYLKGEPELEARFRECDVELRPLGLRFNGDPRPLFRLCRNISTLRPHILHAHLPAAEVYCALYMRLCQQTGVQFYISRHNTGSYGRLRRLEGWANRSARKVICISTAAQRDLLSRTGIDPQITQVVHYGLDPAPFERPDHTIVTAYRQRVGVDRGVVFACLARLEKQKALDFLIEAFSVHARSRPMDRLILAGRGSLERQLAVQVDALGVGKQIIFWGQEKRVPELLAASDALVLTSDWEGFGLVLLEAMAAGRPVIATAVGAIPEIVISGETGILVPPREVAALIEAFRSLLVSGARAKMGASGRSRVHERFSSERMRRAIEAVYAQ